MSQQQVDDRTGQGDDPLSGARLRSVCRRAHVLPFWAVAGVLVPTVWLATVLIAGPSATALTLSSPIIQSMSSHLRPRAPLTEAEDERDNPSNAVPLALGRFNQLLNLEHTVGLDFVLDHRWSFS